MATPDLNPPTVYWSPSAAARGLVGLQFRGRPGPPRMPQTINKPAADSVLLEPAPTALVRELVAALADLERDHDDPGTDALGALWLGRQWLATHPAPAGTEERKPHTPAPAVLEEYRRAIDHWRWCWDCGATARRCMASRLHGQPCCPDCRHRDADAVLIAALLGPPPGEDGRG